MHALDRLWAAYKKFFLAFCRTIRKPTQFSIGIVRTGDHFRWALVSLQNKILNVEKTGEGPSIPEELASIKNLTIVTGLAGEEVLRRTLKLPLTSEKLIRLSLPFQIEPLLPFPQEEALVFPQYYPEKQETTVMIWMTTKETLQSHLSKWQSLGIDPDHVSCQTLALARWARFSFPEKPQLIAIFENLGVALDQNRVVCAMASPDLEKLKAFLKQKYPLFEWVEAPSPFPIPLGLALEAFEKKPLQLRTKEFTSTTQKKQKNAFLKKASIAGALLILFSTASSSLIFYMQERKLQQQIALYLPEKNIEAFRRKVLLEAKTAPPVPNIPTVQETLVWLSSLKAPIDLYHISYDQASASVTLEFLAETPAIADLFVKQLQQSPSFVGSTRELKWTSHSQGYKLCFPLKSL